MTDKYREALFNEIKGSLFEYLTALDIARRAGLEGDFLRSLPTHYQRVLEQQDHMTRELYSELLTLLPRWAGQAGLAWQSFFPMEKIKQVKLTGQLTHTEQGQEQAEADFVVVTEQQVRPVSLKLSKQKGAVNTKSGGIKSFFSTYFPSADVEAWQLNFNQLVDAEFVVMRMELHELASLADDPTWSSWRRRGLSELPGELPHEMRERMHAFYARIALAVKDVLTKIEQHSPAVFVQGLVRLCGFGVPSIVQLICFHDLHGATPTELNVLVHEEESARARILERQSRPLTGVASCEWLLRDWILQIRVKPMNKFTTTAIKMNCSVRY